MRGPQGQAVLKPLLPFRGSTLVETAMGSALDAGCRVILVLGNGGGELGSRLEAGRWAPLREKGLLLLLENERWEEGLLGSIQAALPAVRGKAFFLAHADMPFIEPGYYLALAAARGRLAGRGEGRGQETAVFASQGGRRGHPALLPSAWIPEMLALDPRGAMRDFIAGRPSVLVEMGAGALRDIDTPEEYERALADPP
jgi:molybdenum cofactor cytidylyltransferase